MTTATETLMKFEVFRYQPDWDEPTFQVYDVPYRDDWVVLDALNYIKDTIDGSLTYRWSCRMGVCGSCSAMVNGYPKLTCAAFLSDYMPGPVRVEPLVNFNVERDLVIGLEGFMEKLEKVQPWIVRENPSADDLASEHLQTPAQHAAYQQFSMCINCLLCYAACPVSSHSDEFIGPAALAMAQRYNLDSRDEGIEQRRDVILRDEGIWECSFVGECSAVCPKHVDPAGAIQQAKMTGAVDYYKRLLMPWTVKS